MIDEERQKLKEEELKVCARCIHSIVGINYIECKIGIPPEICPIQFKQKKKVGTE